MAQFGKFSVRSFDWILLASALLLTALGLSAVYSIDLSRGGELLFFKKQIWALGAGLVVFWVASMMQASFFRSAAKSFYAVSLVSLLAVLFFGTNVRGTTGWFVVGGFSFQPAELAKAAVIIMLGYIVANFGRRFERPLFFYGTAGIVSLPVLLIFFQPDLGSALLIISIWLGVMLLVGARWTHLLVLALSAVALVAFSWFFLFQDYQKDRLLTFVNPTSDPLGAGYNVNQSLIAVGAGKWWGRGLGFGSQSQLRFLPEAQTDFVFSVIGEELGFAGVVILLLLFSAVCWRLLRLAQNTDSDFSSVVASGIAILFFVQFVVNVGAGLGVLPVTGVTLPFVSYGGSSLLINFFLLGVAQSLITRKY